MIINKLILLHGALGSKDQFPALKQKLISQLDVYDFNFSGHGTDSIEAEFSIAQFAQDTISFIDQHKLGKVNLFGYSMGGYVALNLAMQYPEKVHKIITLGTKMDWNKETAEKEVKMMIPEMIEEKVPKFAETLRMIHIPNDWKNIMRKTAGMMTALGNGSALKPEDFEKIQNPVLVCIGTEDKMVSVDESRSVTQRLPNGELMILPGFKHPMEMNDMEVLSTILLNFINK